MPRHLLASRRSLLFAIALSAALTPARGDAQGWIEPRPGFPNEQFGIEKLRTTVNVRVNDRVATVEVEEWFRNNGGRLGEGDYVYPLPGEAVFSGYSLYQGDQELRGEMMDALRAREIYENIVRSKRDPALIELMGKGLLRARVFPIEPGQTRRITLRYTQVLDRAGDAMQFRYVAGARHEGGFVPLPRIEPMPAPVPGRPLPRPVQSPEQGTNITRTTAPLTFTMTVENARNYRDAFSPTHELRVERDGDRMTIRPRAELSGDFNVFLPLARAAVGLSLAAHRPDGEDGYFMLTLMPGDVVESRVPRDVTVVVDVSGSMSGEKMDQARGAMRQLLGTLNATDRVRLISFSSTARSWREGWTSGSAENLRDARRWIDDLRAEGGTNISASLEEAFREASPPNRLPVVIFMTDGLPTNGETNAERIVAAAESRRGRARVFAFGVGYDVNTYLLDRLSEAARGSTHYVRPGEDVEVAISSLATKVRHPVLTDLTLDAGAVRITEVYPRNLPDLFAGEELVLFGRYETGGEARIGINGRRGERAERFATEFRFPQRADGNEYISRLWASRKIGDLDRRIRTAQADGAAPRQLEDMINELRQTALRYGLLSEHTSYLVLEPGVVAMRDAAGGVLGRGAGFAAAPTAVTGQAAVTRAEQAQRSARVGNVAEMEAVQQQAAQEKLNEQRRRDGVSLDAVVVTGANGAGQTQLVAGRTFTQQRDGLWQDAGINKAHRVVHVEPYSDAYFALLRELPELSLILRQLNTAAIAGERVTIRVANGGVKTIAATELKRVVTEFRQR